MGACKRKRFGDGGGCRREGGEEERERKERCLLKERKEGNVWRVSRLGYLEC